MITAVDTNILLDVFTANPTYGAASLQALRDAQAVGRLIICEIVLAEIASNFESIESLRATLDRLGIMVEPVGQEASYAAGQAFLSYRKRVKGRERILADFLIGAHAQLRATQLLTRDRGFYRDYFAGLTVLDPAASQ